MLDIDVVVDDVDDDDGSGSVVHTYIPQSIHGYCHCAST
jgi:hypothetical protein